MSDDSKTLSRVEDILSDEDYIPTKPMSRIEKLLIEGGGPGGKLPEVTSDDNGKILKVKDGAWDKGENISGDKLPQVSSQDNGKVLKVVNGEWNIDNDEGDRLPVVTSSDNGKVLTVKNGAWDKADRVKDVFYYSVIISLEDEVVLPTGFGYRLAEAEPKPVYLYNDSTNRLFSPIEIGRTVSGVKEHAKWQCVYTQSNKTYVETIEYNCTSGTDPLVESSTYSKEEITDEKVKQTPTNDGVYDILLSGSTAGSAEATEGAKKSSTYPLKYSTHGNILMVGNSDSSSGGVDIGWAGVPNIGVGKTNSTTGAKNWIRMGLDDISFDSNSSGTPETWDGVNTSLKAAIAAAAGAGGTEAVYLPLADYEELTTAEKEDPTKIYFVINEGTKVSPSIYYKNVLYNPDELPATTVSDAGKVLKVNEDGLWDKGDAPIPDVNAVQVPPVIFDNRKLMKISDMTGFPELEKVFVTSEEYSQLTTAQKQDLSKIYYVSPYKFHSFEGGKIIIRTNANETKWYFNGFEVPNGGTYNVPSEMSSYFAANQASKAYSDESSETNLGYIEFSLNYTLNVIYFQQEFWYGSWIAEGTPVWGVVSKNGGDNQQNTYSDPYDVETPILIYYGGKQYTEYEPAKPYVELTQAEYDALPSSKESDGIIYFITDNS